MGKKAESNGAQAVARRGKHAKKGGYRFWRPFGVHFFAGFGR